MLEAWGKLLDFARFTKRDYRLTFSSIHGQNVLKDLAMFCRARETCVVPGNDQMTYILEGRREVWLHIERIINLNPEQLAELFSGGNYKAGDTNGR